MSRPAAEHSKKASLVDLKRIALVRPAQQALPLSLDKVIPLRVGDDRRDSLSAQRVQHPLGKLSGLVKPKLHQQIAAAAQCQQLPLPEQPGNLRRHIDLHAGIQLQRDLLFPQQLMETEEAAAQRLGADIFKLSRHIAVGCGGNGRHAAVHRQTGHHAAFLL